MRNKLIIITANLVFLFHCVVVFVILFGWCFGKLYIIYPMVLLITLIFESIFGYCILTEVEFKLRKKTEPDLDYDYSFLTYYMYKVYNLKIPRQLLDSIYITFLIISLSIYYYHHFMIK
ncbi:MAG: DUF2784 family protein [Minisyncoccia bacterium]